MGRIDGLDSMVKTNLPKLSIRLDLPNGSRFGPGKAALLIKIKESGSIAGAARALEMSYPRALRLVGEMNQQFSNELVEKFQGGANRGGAALTDLGNEVLKIYSEIAARSETTAEPAMRALRRVVR